LLRCVCERGFAEAANTLQLTLRFSYERSSLCHSPPINREIPVHDPIAARAAQADGQPLVRAINLDRIKEVSGGSNKERASKRA